MSPSGSCEIIHEQHTSKIIPSMGSKCAAWIDLCLEFTTVFLCRLPDRKARKVNCILCAARVTPNDRTGRISNLDKLETLTCGKVELKSKLSGCGATRRTTFHPVTFHNCNFIALRAQEQLEKRMDASTLWWFSTVHSKHEANVCLSLLALHTDDNGRTPEDSS